MKKYTRTLYDLKIRILIRVVIDTFYFGVFCVHLGNFIILTKFIHIILPLIFINSNHNDKVVRWNVPVFSSSQHKFVLEERFKTYINFIYFLQIF